MDVDPIYTKIDKSIQVNAGVIVLENHQGFPRNESNLYLIGQSGKIIWKAENGYIAGSDCRRDGGAVGF